MPNNDNGMTMKDLKGFGSKNKYKQRNYSNTLELRNRKIKKKHCTDKNMSNHYDVSNKKKYDSAIVLEKTPSENSENNTRDIQESSYMGNMQSSQLNCNEQS